MQTQPKSGNYIQGHFPISVIPLSHIKKYEKRFKTSDCGANYVSLQNNWAIPNQ